MVCCIPLFLAPKPEQQEPKAPEEPKEVPAEEPKEDEDTTVEEPEEVSAETKTE
jgi:hypothetical protein